MNWVDLLIVVAVATYALSGYRNGAVVGTLSIVGFMAGALIGGQLAHPVGTALASGRAQISLGLACVLGCAVIGQLAGVALARPLRRRITHSAGRQADAGLGSVLSAIGVLVVVWMLALPLASAPYPSVSRQVRQSTLVHGVDTVMPAPMRSVYASLRGLVDRTGFPQVFGALQPSRIRGVDPPDDALTRSPVVRSVRASVVKIRSAAPDCDRRTEGSGFVYAAGRVMTNAHVVAGSDSVTVEGLDGPRDATVVLYDSDRDVAVLAVDGLNVPALRFAGRASGSGADAIVAGYPEDGPFRADAGRIRDRERAVGADIYGGAGVSRQVYAVRARVQPGNSGGPLLGTDGRVLGVVFATAVDSPGTGYALTAAEVGSSAAAGRSADARVSTQGCT
ncbi:MAG: MarP family serine protease [bacterium]